MKRVIKQLERAILVIVGGFIVLSALLPLFIRYVSPLFGHYREMQEANERSFNGGALVVTFAIGGALLWWARSIVIPPPPTSRKAIDELLARVDRGGDADAEYRLGVIYETGNGVKPDQGQAAEWYRKAAAHEHVDAMYEYACRLSAGRGVEKDVPKAIAWFEQAAQLGDEASKHRLAELRPPGVAG